MSLLCLQSFSSLILQSFQNVIERNIVIALFLTMLTGTAGNAGNQVSPIILALVSQSKCYHLKNRKMLRIRRKLLFRIVPRTGVTEMCSFCSVLLDNKSVVFPSVDIARVKASILFVSDREREKW